MNYLIPVAVLPLLTACGMSQVAGVAHPTISGSLVVRNKDGSETRWTPDRCLSGDLAYFVGFDFLSTHDPGNLRVLLDPVSGPVALWNIDTRQSQNALVLRRENCARLDLDAQPTAWRVNDVREFGGYVELQCAAADGTRFEGRIAVDHCH